MKLSLSLLALVSVALVGCRSSERRLAFDPSPFRAEIRAADGEVTARVLLAAPAAVAALEAVPADGVEGPFLQLLVRVENRAAGDLVFDPARVFVVDDELAEFGPAIADPAAPSTVTAGSTGSFVLYLPYPEGVGLHGTRPRGLDVRLVLRRGGDDLELSASLRRVVETRTEVYYGPMYGPWYDPWYPYTYWHRWQLTDPSYRDLR